MSKRIAAALHGAAIVTLLLATASLPGTALAGFYKCVAADGSTSYTQRPCPIASSSARMPGERPRDTMDCAIARHFLWQTGNAMRAGDPSHVVFGRYGGMDSLSPNAIALINYVYTYRGDTDTSIDRVVALGTRRCEAGSFGRMDCSVFPARFITGAGGCEAAAGLRAPPGEPASALPAERGARGGWLEAPAPGASRYR